MGLVASGAVAVQERTVEMNPSGMTSMAEDGAEEAPTGIVPVVAHTFTALMEQLQEGYVAGVAATAGCSVEFVRRDLYTVDALIIRSIDKNKEEVSVKAQMKNTTLTRPDPDKPFFSYKFKRREQLAPLVMPRKDPKMILLVMVTTPIQAEWTACDHDSLTMRHCCYWAYLEGYGVDPNVQSPTVRIKTANVFDGKALTEIMDKLDRGEAPE